MRTVQALASGLPPVCTIVGSTIAKALHYKLTVGALVPVAAGGTGYLIGEVLTIENTGATGTDATIKVTNVTPSTGAVTEAVVLTAGDYTVKPTDVLTNAATGSDAGTSATFAITTIFEDFATVTFTAARAHRLTTGQKARVAVASTETAAIRLAYQGDFEVTVTSATVFTYNTINLTLTAPEAAASVTAQVMLRPPAYDPFAAVRMNRLQVEDAVPDYTLYVADTNEHTGTWREILALEATVVHALTSTTLSGFADGMKIPAGTRIKGVFTMIDLTSGSVLLSE